MRVKVIQNKLHWNVDDELLAVRECFSPYMNIGFKVEEAGIPMKWKRPEYVEENKVDASVRDKFLDRDFDVIVVNMPSSQWKAKGIAGYAQWFKYGGVWWVYMKSEPGRKRKHNNGWLDDNEFAGRLRHELVHIFYNITQQKDILHESEYDKDNFDLVLKDLDWSVFFKQKPMLECPIQNTAVFAGLWKQKRPRVSQKFGNDFKINGKWVYQGMGMKGHNGVDYAVPVGTPVFAPMDGVVQIKESNNGYGLHIKIRNEHKELECVLGHLSKVLVPDGAKINSKDKIALSGNTGFSTAPHLHEGYRNIIPDLTEDIFDWRVLNYNNGYFGYFDHEEFSVTWKGTLLQNNL